MKKEQTPDYSDVNRLNKFQKTFFGYGCYHNDMVNILTHIMFVPLITITLDKIMYHYSVDVLKMPFNPFLILQFIVSIIYIYVDPTVGGFTTVQYFCWSYFTRDIKFDAFGLSHIQMLIAVHCVSWIAQFITHAFFERRRPALVDNFSLTISAPVFVNIELFYYLFGYRKEEIIEAKKYIEYNIKEFHNQYDSRTKGE
jgi:uncharacterized membrane protein YGL010W